MVQTLLSLLALHVTITPRTLVFLKTNLRWPSLTSGATSSIQSREKPRLNMMPPGCTARTNQRIDQQKKNTILKEMTLTLACRQTVTVFRSTNRCTVIKLEIGGNLAKLMRSVCRTIKNIRATVGHGTKSGKL